MGGNMRPRAIAPGWWHKGPTMVWHRTPPGDRYWEWVSWARHTVLTVAPTKLLELWIELQARAVALFRYPGLD